MLKLVVFCAKVLIFQLYFRGPKIFNITKLMGLGILEVVFLFKMVHWCIVILRIIIN